MLLSPESDSCEPSDALVQGDRVELITAIPGHPDLRPGKCGVVLLAADELDARGLCTVRIGGRPGHCVWQLHPRDLRRLGPELKRGQRAWTAV